MIKKPYKCNFFFAADGLLGSCRKHAQFHSAHKLYGRMPIRGIKTLSAAFEDLNLYTNNNNKTRNVGSIPDRFGYAGALGVCGRNADLRNGRIIHGLAVVSGLARQVFLINSLIDMYSNCGKIDDVRLVFDYASELDDVSWNLLLSAYVRIRWPEVAVDILVWMHRSGVKLDGVALGSVLKAVFCESDDPEPAQKLLLVCVIKVGLDSDSFVGNAMKHAFAKSGGLDEVLEVLDSISNLSLVVFNAMICGFSRLGIETCREMQSVALRLYIEMIRRRMRPSKLTLKSVIDACASNKHLYFGKQIHAHVVKNNLEADESIGTALITMYSDSGSVEQSLKLFESTPMQEICTWGSMIRGYVQNGYIERAMEMFRNLLRFGRMPSPDIVSSLLVGLGNLGVVRSGEQLHGYALKEGVDRLIVFGNSQMFFYSNIGDFDASVKIFQDTASVDTVASSMVILNHALHGQASDALASFEKMKKIMISPKHSAFHAVLMACSHGGLIAEGFRYLESMATEYGLPPKVNHCACIVDLLGRSRQFSMAEDFILSSGYNNDPVMWRPLLRSCQYHGDTEWIIRVGEKLMELDPIASTSYMLLYDTYSGMGKISLAMKIRGRMRERGINKEIGVSWIEIGPVVHAFSAGDSTHPQSSMIYSKLEEILLKLKIVGNGDVKIPKFKYEGEKWKNTLMKSHDEKLAVSLGMIFLPESVPIRVIKNMWMCEDCHTTMKLFSEVERRKIIIRDRSRLHHFNCGSCSCGDYW